MGDIARYLQAISANLALKCLAAGRKSTDCSVIAVSKTRPLADILAAAACGQRDFAENYVQEGIAKIAAAKALGVDLCWHFIGPLQRNKTRAVAENFDWVHSVDQLILAERLSAQRPLHLPPLQLCVQVNISGEKSKSGCLPQVAYDLCEQIVRLPRVHLRGLMCIPAETTDRSAQESAFSALRDLREKINQRGLSGDIVLDSLSMGMSEDMDAAIACGATHLRIGRAIFGERH